MQISVVIPALNEASSIGATLRRTRDQLEGFSHEVIVVDHGSEDSTCLLAESAGARVIRREGGTIGALRNAGAKAARGEALLFLDADIQLAKTWRRHLPVALARISRPEPVVTGSLCVPPREDRTWIERHWFQQMPRTGRLTYIGTAHMLIRRQTFFDLDGFDESLETGEDFDLCRRLREAGGEVISDPDLKAVHYGFPQTIPTFVLREAWHGLGDTSSSASIVRSKVALAALVFLFTHLLVFLGGVTGSPGLTAAGTGALAALLVASSHRKYHRAPAVSILVNSVLYYFYYVGRTCSFVRGFIRRPERDPAAGSRATPPAASSGQPNAAGSFDTGS